MVEVVRTPDERFRDLPDWPFEPHYVEAGGLRLARADVGPREAEPVMLVHGEPTWAFLWRRVMHPLIEAGHRTVAVDQVGFGRSDKPVDRDWFTYDRLVDSFDAHLEAIGFHEPITLVVHDWGGLVGLRWAVEHPASVRRLVLLNTGLWTPSDGAGSGHSEAWTQFRRFVERSDELPIAMLVDGGCATDLSDDVRMAYEAPFPGPDYQAGAHALPLLVPTSADDPGVAEMVAAREELAQWGKPTYVLWGADDPILPTKIGERFVRDIPGARDLDTVPGMHFLQEDAGDEIGRRIAAFIRDS